MMSRAGAGHRRAGPIHRNAIHSMHAPLMARTRAMASRRDAHDDVKPTRLVTGNDTPFGRALNRRIELLITGRCPRPFRVRPSGGLGPRNTRYCSFAPRVFVGCGLVCPERKACSVQRRAAARGGAPAAAGGTRSRSRADQGFAA